VRVHVAFTPEEEGAAPVGIVVDVIRATSSIAQALAAGYERVLCCAEIDEARALRADLGEEAVVGGERSDAAIAASVLAGAWPSPLDGLNARTYGPPGLEADIEFCAQVDLLETVPRFARMVGTAAEIIA